MEGPKAQRYFNVPIQLLKGFLVDKEKTLSQIVYYAVYEYCLKESCTIEKAESFFKIELTRKKQAFASGELLYTAIPLGSPKVGVNVSKLFQFLKSDCSEFDKVCFLAFLAIRSILQKKSYCKIDNRFLLARMDGQVKAVLNFDELSEEIRKYSNEYQTVKIKRALVETWHLTTYSHYTRGFYVSFTMKLCDLIFEAEKRRKASKEMLYRQKQDEALKIALGRLSYESANKSYKKEKANRFSNNTY